LDLLNSLENPNTTKNLSLKKKALPKKHLKVFIYSINASLFLKEKGLVWF